MFIQQIPSGPFDTNAYVIRCEETKKAAIVDPAPDSAAAIVKVLEKNGFIVDKILLTHSHWDHIGNVKTLKEKYGVQVYIHEEDAGNLEDPGSDGLPIWGNIPGVKADVFLHEGDGIRIGNLTFIVIETPGHTPGGVCFYNAENGILISGDTLFHGSIGNLSFPTARPDKMWNSLDKLAKLPPQTKVYAGHGPATTIGKENWLPQARKLFGG